MSTGLLKQGGNQVGTDHGAIRLVDMRFQLANWSKCVILGARRADQFMCAVLVDDQRCAGDFWALELAEPQAGLDHGPMIRDPYGFCAIRNSFMGQAWAELHSNIQSVIHQLLNERQGRGEGFWIEQAPGASLDVRAAGRVQPNSIDAGEVSFLGSAVNYGRVFEWHEVQGRGRGSGFIHLYCGDFQAGTG